MGGKPEAPYTNSDQLRHAPGATCADDVAAHVTISGFTKSGHESSIRR